MGSFPTQSLPPSIRHELIQFLYNQLMRSRRQASRLPRVTPRFGDGLAFPGFQICAHVHGPGRMSDFNDKSPRAAKIISDQSVGNQLCPIATTDHRLEFISRPD